MASSTPTPPTFDKLTTPYGSWKSPITADVVSGADKRLGGTAIDSRGRLFWLESRPTESGRSYTNVLKEFFEEKLLCSQQLFSEAERYEKILQMVPDESITSELRGKWQDNRRSSNAKDVNVVRWEQVKHLL